MLYRTLTVSITPRCSPNLEIRMNFVKSALLGGGTVKTNCPCKKTRL